MNMNAYAYIIEFQDDRPQEYGLISTYTFTDAITKISLEYDEKNIRKINIQQLMDDQWFFRIPEECFDKVCDANICF